MIKSLLDARIADGVPQIVARQDWVQAISTALGAIHKRTLGYADGSQVYTALDDVPVEVLDALAVYWKIDWYDTDYSVEQKRRIIKSALTVRRLMGTVRAVKLQVEAIFPGTTLQEWFEYGGTPGCFRLDVNLTDEAIKGQVVMQTPEEIERKIVTAKRWSAHLEGVDYREETEAPLSVGGYTAIDATLEIWPGLVEELEFTAEAGVDALPAMQQTMEIWPELTESLEATAEARTDALSILQGTLEIWPKLVESVEATAEAVAGALSIMEQAIEICTEEDQEVWRK